MINESVRTAGTVRYNYDGTLASYIPDNFNDDKAPQPKEISYDDIELIGINYENAMQTIDDLNVQKNELEKEIREIQSEMENLEPSYIMIENSVISIKDVETTNHKQNHKRYKSLMTKKEKNFEEIKKINWTLQLLESKKQVLTNEYRSKQIISLVSDKIGKIKSMFQPEMIESLKNAINEVMTLSKEIRNNGFYFNFEKHQHNDLTRAGKYLFELSEIRNYSNLQANILSKGFHLSIFQILELQFIDGLLNQLESMENILKIYDNSQKESKQ